MDDFPQKPPLFWRCLGAGLVILALAMLFYTSRAEAQPACEPLAKVIDDLGSKFEEVIAWEGTAVPRGSNPPAQVLLFQSPKGTWTLLAVHGVTACLMAVGTDAAPLETGKGV